MAAGWIGQMAGVGQGAATEFKFRGHVMPAEAVPPWTPEMVNQFEQDDLYVEMTFLHFLQLHGLDISPRQAGIDFANSGYRVWHANRAGLQNLRAGIAPPDSGHPRFSRHADDLDYQIEADYSGLIAPGIPAATLQLGEIFGRMMCYGDGLYGGQFVGGMYAEAFFEEDPRRIVEAGLRCIPPDSQYAACIRDVLAWHQEDPQDRQATWRRIESTWRLDPDHRRFSCTSDDLDIDAKLNGAYVVLGLLYGSAIPRGRSRSPRAAVRTPTAISRARQSCSSPASHRARRHGAGVLRDPAHRSQARILRAMLGSGADRRSARSCDV